MRNTLNLFIIKYQYRTIHKGRPAKGGGVPSGLIGVKMRQFLKEFYTWEYTGEGQDQPSQESGDESDQELQL